jgi:hypothetical protein
LSENLCQVMIASAAKHESPIQQSAFFLPIEPSLQKVGVLQRGINCIKNSILLISYRRGQPNGSNNKQDRFIVRCVS